MMYDKIKILLNNPTYRYIVIGGIGLVICLCLGYIFYQPSGTDYQRARESVERIEKQQRESLELNRSIQHSIDRSTDLSREAGARIDRSSQYNQQIGERIGKSQSGLSEARNYLKRNAELFRLIEEQNRAGQPHNQETTNATQHIPGGGSWSDNWSGNSSIAR